MKYSSSLVCATCNGHIEMFYLLRHFCLFNLHFLVIEDRETFLEKKWKHLKFNERKRDSAYLTWEAIKWINHLIPPPSFWDITSQNLATLRGEHEKEGRYITKTIINIQVKTIKFYISLSFLGKNGSIPETLSFHQSWYPQQCTLWWLRPRNIRDLQDQGLHR